MRTFRRYVALLLLFSVVSILAVVAEGSSRTAAILVGSGSPGPLNFSFESQPFDVGTPPTNHDFASGDLTDWTVLTGTVSVQIRDPGDYYARADSILAKLESSLFTVPSDAQTIRWQHIDLGGSIGYDVDIVVDGTPTRLASAVKASSFWKTFTRNITNWQGQTIQLRFNLGQNTGIDNSGVSRNVVPHWDTSGPVSGVPVLLSDGPHGSYVVLTNGMHIFSSPFLLTQTISYQRQFLRQGVLNCTQARLLNADDDSWIANIVVADCGQAGDWETVSGEFADIWLQNWNGGLVKYEIFVAGTVALDAGVVSGTTAHLNTESNRTAETEDPVDTSMGDLSHGHTDLLIPGRGVPLEFSRFYHSQAGRVGSLGNGWSHSYDMDLTFLSGGSISVHYPDGGTAHFEKSGSTFVPPAGVHDDLVDNGDTTYTLTTKAQIRFNFDSAGTLTSIQDRNNNTTTLTYVNSRLSSVSDPGGRSLNFTYEPTFDVINTPDPALAFTNSDFEAGTYLNWTTTDTAFGSAPSSNIESGKQGTYYASSYRPSGSVTPTGTLTSQEFTAGRQLTFRINGGADVLEQYVALVLSDNTEVLSTANDDASFTLRTITWDTSAYEGQQVRIRATDNGSGSNDHVGLDYVQVLYSATGSHTPERGVPVEPFTNADFELNTWANWDVTGTAFGRRPARHSSNFYHADSFGSGDAPTGSVTSVPFTAGSSVSFLLAGSNDPGFQRLPLDVVVSFTNLTDATVPFLDDDPDADDGDWATATTVADTSLRAGFPTPAGNPTVGADLQEFRILLRKDAAGGNDPTYDLELWESGGGAPLATLASGVTLSSDTGVVVSATWDASLLGAADGAAVELVVVGNRSGGPPNNRRTVEVGAVEWNVDYDASNPYAALVLSDDTEVLQTTGDGYTDDLEEVLWDTSQYAGQTVRLRLVDNSTAGHMLADDFKVVYGDRIAKVTGPLTREVQFSYDARGDLASVTDVEGGTTTYAYSGHSMTSLTDSNNHVAVQNIHDSARRAVEQTDAVGGVTCIYYGSGPSYTSPACPGVTPGPTESQTIVVDPEGHQTTYTYDDSFRTTDIEDDLGNVLHTDFDTDNNVTCITDQLLNKTGFAYDAAGNVTQIINALNTDANCLLKVSGVDSTFTYTADNDIDLATDPLGRETDYIYDASGNLTRVVRQVAGPVIKSLTCFERDTNGLMTALVESTDLVLPALPTDPCTGNKTLFEYDTNGNQTAVVDPRFSGQPTPPKTTFSPDLGGRVLTITNELSHTTTNTYDDQNNVFTVADNLGNTTSNTYDAKGNLKTVTDANRQTAGATPETGAQCGAAGTGNGINDDPADDSVIDDGCPSAIYTYDDADRLTGVIDALGQSTTYGYDGNGNRTSVTNARGKITTYAYDTLDRLQSTTDALSRVTSYGYDAASNLSQRTDAKRQPVGPPETGADCGAAGAGNGVDEDADTVPDDGCPTAVYAYDVLNRLTDLDYSDQAVDYTYDDVGNRLTMVDPTGTTIYVYDALNRPTSVSFPGPSSVSYQYDNVGDRSRITYPDTKFVDYTYDEADNLKTATDWLTKQTVYTYDNAGNLTKTALPNGASTDFGYDTADRLTSVVNKNAGGTISSFTYTLDGAGHRTQMVDLAGTHTYDYDDLYRLEQVTYPDPQTDTYTYDPVGNRLTRSATAYTYDDADQMLTAGGVSYGYDANGNQETRGADTFTYDHENRLTQAVIGGVTSSSIYNGDGLRLSHTEGVTTTSYTWDVAAGLPVVIQDDDNTYVYGLDLISTTDGAGVQSYSLNDGLGSTTDLTDGSANPTDDYSYDVFGTIRSQSGSSSNYWLFTGEQRDGQPGVAGGVQRLPLDVVVSSTNLTGATVANLDDDPDDDEGDWATAVASPAEDTSLRVGFPTPPGDPTPGAGLQEFRVLLRKDAAGGNDPTYDIELWETGGGAPLATLVSGATLSSDTTGEVVSATWDASLLGTADGSIVELKVVGHRSGGNPTKRRTVEVGAVEWNVDFGGTPGSELYFLRARYYDPETGRFLSQDPLPAGNLYVYVGNNPVRYIDPLGLCKVKVKFWETAKECTEEAVDSFVDDPVGSATKILDTTAFAIDAGSAYVTDFATVWGCALGSCPAGYIAGWLATSPARLVSNYVSGVSASITCIDALAGGLAKLTGSADKEGGFAGGKLGKSSAGDCAVGALTAWAGWALPEPNANALIAGYQVCYDFGNCDAPWDYVLRLVR